MNEFLYFPQEDWTLHNFCVDPEGASINTHCLEQIYISYEYFPHAHINIFMLALFCVSLL